MVEAPRSSTAVRTAARRPSWPRWRQASVAVSASIGILMVMGDGGAAPSLRTPRSPIVIQRIVAETSHQDLCEKCHSAHANDQVSGPYPNALLGPDDNSLCLSCHSTPWQGGSLATSSLYLGTSHGSDPSMAWPGPDPPARIESDARGKCLNCHDPHGWEDASGLVPHLELKREENLCLQCHDGSPATTNVQIDLLKPYRHPTAIYSGRHSGPLESDPTQFGVVPLDNRHAECEDCHNPHVSRPDGSFGPAGNDASLTTLGVSRVAVLNGPAGSPPAYSFVAGSDTLTAPVAEYQLCFKCHSSWTSQPSGQTDEAMVLNPGNPSYHPVEALGRNPSIAPLAFASGWSATSITRCGDCHGSDAGTPRGPHGSIYPSILRRNYSISSLNHVSTPDELCFACHSYDTYANSGSLASVRAASRFNAPGATKGHAEHVMDNQIPCYACHITHGSTGQPYLIAIGRTPGILSYSSNATGGTCTPSCHGTETYTVNYGR